MVQAYGSDRVRIASDGRIFLSSRAPKQWQPRSVRAASSIPHPGTAVLWDDAFYEVLEVTALPNGAVRYELAPFPDDLLMRGSVAYDEASELAQLADSRHVRHRERTRKIVTILAPVTGHAPAAVQDWLHQEIGTPPVALTAISAIPPIVFGAVCLRWLLNLRMEGAALPVPVPVVDIALLLGIESAFRLYNSAVTGRPIGSVAGLVLYAIAHPLFLRSSAVPGAFKPHGPARPGATPPDDVALRDALSLREPFLTLLALRDQEILRSRYGFDPARYGRKTALVILIPSALGTLTSLAGLLQGRGVSALISLLVAAVLVVEQFVRWPALASTGAPSILRFVVRPLAGRLLD
jgi:hypothetical protein